MEFLVTLILFIIILFEVYALYDCCRDKNKINRIYKTWEKNKNTNNDIFNIINKS